MLVQPFLHLPSILNGDYLIGEKLFNELTWLKKKNNSMSFYGLQLQLKYTCIFISTFLVLLSCMNQEGLWTLLPLF